jgi:hypothetical protein
MRRLRRVFVCSAFRGDVARNVEVARAACRQVALEGDAPFAPHLLYPDFLDDGDAMERAFGIGSGLAWLAVADEILVVGEPTEGMRAEIAAAETLGLPIRRVDAPVAAHRQDLPLLGTIRLWVIALWADWGPLLALAVVVLVFLACPGCVAAGCRGACESPEARG